MLFKTWLVCDGRAGWSPTVVLHEGLWRVGEAALRVQRRPTVSMLPWLLHVDDGFNVQPAETYSPTLTGVTPHGKKNTPSLAAQLLTNISQIPTFPVYDPGAGVG